MNLSSQIAEERKHFVPEQAGPDPQTARLRDLIALLDHALTDAYRAKREAKRAHERIATA